MSAEELDAAKSIYFDEDYFDARYEEDGTIKPLFGVITPAITATVANQQAKKAEILKVIANTEFDDLEEVEQHDESFVWVAKCNVEDQEYSFFISQSDIVQTVMLTEATKDDKALLMDKYHTSESETVVNIDGKEYFVEFHVCQNLFAGEDLDILVDMGIFVIGGSPVADAIVDIVKSHGTECFSDAYAQLSADVLDPFWKYARHVMRMCYRFFSAFLKTLFSGDSFDDAVNASHFAAGKVWETTVRDIDHFALSRSLAPVVLTVSRTLLVNAPSTLPLLHVYLYNLTSCDIQLDIEYIDNCKQKGEMTDAPVQGDSYICMVPYGMGNWYNGSSISLEGVDASPGASCAMGGAFSLTLKDTGSDHVVAKYSVMFKIQGDGKNSLYAMTKATENYEQFFKQHENETSEYHYRAADVMHEVIVTFDALEGKTEHALSKSMIYLYNSLIVVRDV